jgi:hypothetical protein
MAESNGTGRLDRVEAILEKVGERLDKMSEHLTTTTWLHEERLLKIEANVEQMQEDEKAYRAAQRERDAVTGDRIDKLVIAIGNFIASQAVK